VHRSGGYCALGPTWDNVHVFLNHPGKAGSSGVYPFLALGLQVLDGLASAIYMRYLF